MFSHRFTVLFASFAAFASARDCQCGFSINDVNASTQYNVFTEYLETDFTQNSLRGWVPQDWGISPQVARGPFGKNASSKNVILSDEGLQLWVRKAVGTGVPMAEVDSQRTDMLYGSFRMRAKMSGTNGTCGAMFWYHNNTQEIDMEFLSKQYNETDGSNINLVIQSPESEANGYNAVYTPGFALPHLPFRPDSAFHEYRFDWTPDQVEYYADGVLLHTMTENVPNAGGHMVFNHWSNGDPGWSAGPPDQDTFITISHAHLYFNSSDAKNRKQYTKLCPSFNATQVCAMKNDTTVALMPPAGASGSYSPSSPMSASQSAYPSPTSTSWNYPNESLETVKNRATKIYIIVGVVLGLVIVFFVVCMMTFRFWAALKNKIARQLGSQRATGTPGPDAEKLNERALAKDVLAETPEVDSPVSTPVKPAGSRLTKTRM